MKATIIPTFDLLVRLSVGFMFANSGWGKLHNLNVFISQFASWGIPAPSASGRIATWVELLAGIAIIVGIAVRVSAVLLSGIMVGALITVVAPPIFEEATTWPGVASLLFYTPEWLLLSILLGYVICGPSRVALDTLISRRWAMRKSASARPDGSGH